MEAHYGWYLLSKYEWFLINGWLDRALDICISQKNGKKNFLKIHVIGTEHLINFNQNSIIVFKSVLGFDLHPYSGAWTLGCGFMT